MGRPRKHEYIDGSQRQYLASEKGKAATARYESSQKRKENKANRWAEQRSLQLSKRTQKFLAKYGNLESVSKILDERELEVIVKVFGLNGNLPTKQKDIAAQWGVKPQWISEIKISAIAKLDAAVKEGTIELDDRT